MSVLEKLSWLGLDIPAEIECLLPASPRMGRRYPSCLQASRRCFSGVKDLPACTSQVGNPKKRLYPVLLHSNGTACGVSGNPRSSQVLLANQLMAPRSTSHTTRPPCQPLSLLAHLLTTSGIESFLNLRCPPRPFTHFFLASETFGCRVCISAFIEQDIPIQAFRISTLALVISGLFGF